jgi:stage V sporulation protein AF
VATAKLVQAMRRSEPRRHFLVRDLDVNVEHFNEVLGFGTSYDILLRRFTIAGIRIATYTINGLYEGLVNIEILKELASVELPEPPDGSEEPSEGRRLRFVRQLLQERLAYSQVTVVHDFDEAVLQVLSGPMIVLVDGEASVVVVDTRDYPTRSPSEPSVEQVINGPRDGLVENIIINTALIRRRVRDPGVRFELHRVGRRSRTDVAIAYIEGITNPELVARVRERLRAIDTASVATAEAALAEFLGQSPWNPFPMVRTTQRPEVVAINLYEGHVVLVTDTSPVAAVVPATFFQMLQHPEDYYVNPVFGTYMRLVEWVALVAAVLVPPVWLLLATRPGVHAALPGLSFIGTKKTGEVPLALQFVLAEIAIDVLRRAMLNSTQGLATTFGILGAVVLGDIATKTGIFSPEALVYLVFAAVSSFSVSNLQLGMATRLMRLTLVVLEWLWALPGIVVGLLFWFVLAVRSESLGIPYLWPLVPFDWLALRSVLLRQPVTWREPRPAVLGPQDRLRRRPPSGGRG